MSTMPNHPGPHSRGERSGHGMTSREECTDKGAAPGCMTSREEGDEKGPGLAAEDEPGNVRRAGIRRQRPGISSRLASRKRPSMVPAILALMLLILLIIWYLHK